MRPHDAGAGKISRVGRRRDAWRTMINARQQAAIASGTLLVLILQRGRALMPLVSRLLFGCRRCSAGSAVATVVAGAAHATSVDHGLVVGIGYRHRAKVVYGAIVLEGATAPEATGIANTAISKAVVQATVKTNMWTPVTAVPKIGATEPAPITGRP